MLQPVDQTPEDTGWFDWWAALYCDESFAAARPPEEEPWTWEDDDYYPRRRWPNPWPWPPA